MIHIGIPLQPLLMQEPATVLERRKAGTTVEGLEGAAEGELGA